MSLRELDGQLSSEVFVTLAYMPPNLFDFSKQTTPSLF